MFSPGFLTQYIKKVEIPLPKFSVRPTPQSYMWTIFISTVLGNSLFPLLLSLRYINAPFPRHSVPCIFNIGLCLEPLRFH